MYDEHTYFVHEDDWAMIEFLPIENRYDVEATMANDPEPGSMHLDTRPVMKCPIAIHGLSVSSIEHIFGDVLQPVNMLTTGRTHHMETVENGFALYHDLIGAIYGTHHDGMVCSLYFDNRLCDCDVDLKGLKKGLQKLGRKYNLFLADWWMDSTVELEELPRIETYLVEE